jgi:hypothetical protein
MTSEARGVKGANKVKSLRELLVVIGLESIRNGQFQLQKPPVFLMLPAETAGFQMGMAETTKEYMKQP